MRVYFGNRNNNYFILSPDYNECYSFNRFGTLENKEASISSCENWVEVDFVSFVSVGGNKTEIMFNGEKAVLGLSLFDCTSKIRHMGNYLGTMFTLKHEDEQGKFTQVFFIAHKGRFTKSIFSREFGISSWNSL